MPFAGYPDFAACTRDIKAQYRKKNPSWTEKHLDEVAGAVCGQMEKQTRQGLHVAYQAKFEPFTDGKRHFVKIFNVDDSWNRNDWAVTPQARERSLPSFFNQPLLGPAHLSNEHVVDANPRHPHYGTWAKIGHPVDVQNNGGTYGIYEITVPEAWRMIEAKELSAVSPSVHILNEVEQPDGKKRITDYAWDHTLFIDTPAYHPGIGVVDTCVASDPSLCDFAQAAQAAYLAQGVRVRLGGTTIDLVFNPDDFKDVDAFVQKAAELGIPEADARKAWEEQQQIVKGHAPAPSGVGARQDVAGYSTTGNPTEKKSEENPLGGIILPDEKTEQGCKEAQAKLEARVKALEDKTVQGQSTAPQDKPTPEQIAQAQEIKDLKDRLQARDDAELSEKALGVADLEVQAGLIKEDKKTERIAELKKFGVPALNDMQARHKVLVEKVQAAKAPREAHRLKAEFDDAMKDPAQAANVQEQIRQAQFQRTRTPEEIAKLEQAISGVR